ncbi:MAG: prepilin-type N-terminal cleavage/methylation domain-containing protein [Proteobacteria bacterium]|nr:prepilin-type N-terminal cleavage/methylation domain-containing protein [Pseudomonadota bacterium]
MGLLLLKQTIKRRVAMSENIKRQAFTLIELSIVTIIIGLVVAGIVAGQSLISAARLTNAKTLTSSSPVGGIEHLELWLETTSKDSFDVAETLDGVEVTNWYDLNNQQDKKNAGNKVGSITYNKNGINSLPSLYIPDNALETERLDLGTNYIFSSGSGEHNGITIFAVVKAQTPNTNNEKFIVDFGIYGVEGYGVMYRSSFFHVYLPSSHGGTGKYFGHALKEQPVILTVRVTFNSILEMFINHNRYSTSQANTTLAKLTTTEINESSRPFSIGGQSKGGGENRSFVGDIGEIIVYSRALSNFEKEEIENYLSKKWKISLTY